MGGRDGHADRRGAVDHERRGGLGRESLDRLQLYQPLAHRADDPASACGCAGIFSAHAAIELYAEIFEAEGILPRLQGFACHHGADFYRLPRNQEHIVLLREAWSPPPSYPFEGGELVPLRAGERIAWRLQGALV